jgi:mitogen-activated protein kinase 1/3
MSSKSLDLLSKMLTFSPNSRLTIEQCLSHPYFEGLHDDNEPTSDEFFDWSWDNFELRKDTLQTMVYEEAVTWSQKMK